MSSLVAGGVGGSMVMEESPDSWKHQSPTVLTDAGTVMELRLLHFLKHSLLSASRLSERSMELKEVQPKKQLSSILVMELGKVMLYRLVQFLKHPQPKLVTELGIETEYNSVQSLKVCWPILVTDAGIEMVLRLVQPSKQPSMFVTELGKRWRRGWYNS